MQISTHTLYILADYGCQGGTSFIHLKLAIVSATPTSNEGTNSRNYATLRVIIPPYIRRKNKDRNGMKYKSCIYFVHVMEYSINNNSLVKKMSTFIIL